MITKNEILNTVFFDIETTTRYKTFEEYAEAEPFMVDDFQYRRSLKSEYANKTDEQTYAEHGMVYPEHGQVVSIAWKKWDGTKFAGETLGFKDWEDYESRDKKYADRDMLIQFNETLHNVFSDNFGKLGGYRIKWFDVPFVYKRMLINGILPHPSLINVGKKPWEIPYLDLYDWWQGVGVNGMSGFGSACEVLGSLNPKGDKIDGRHVCFRFWDDHAIDMINEYCMRDVDANIDFAINLSHDKLTSKYKRTLEDYSTRMEEQQKKETENEVGE